MNFIAAIQHASIGYGIRRKAWRENVNCWLILVNHELHWCEGNVASVARLLGDDITCDLLAEDIAAGDWETL